MLNLDALEKQTLGVLMVPKLLRRDIGVWVSVAVMVRAANVKKKKLMPNYSLSISLMLLVIVLKNPKGSLQLVVLYYVHPYNR